MGSGDKEAEEAIDLAITHVTRCTQADHKTNAIVCLRKEIENSVRRLLIIIYYKNYHTI